MRPTLRTKILLRRRHILSVGSRGQEAVNSVIAPGREYGIELDVSTNAMALKFVGGDTNRLIVRLLQRVAAIIRAAEGEIQCERPQEMAVNFPRILQDSRRIDLYRQYHT